MCQPILHRQPTTLALGGRDAHLYLGDGPLALEVVTVPFDARPTITELRELFKERAARRAAPVLIVGLWGGDRAAVCGPTEHNAIEQVDLPRERVEAVVTRALAAADRHRAIRILLQDLPQVEAAVPGVRNGGLLAMQELEHGVPDRADWTDALARGREVRGRRGRALIEGLGFTTEETAGPALILLAGDRKTAVAVLLDHPEEIDAASDRFDGVSPVSFALARADREHLDYVMAVAGSTVRLYPVRPGVGAGRRGRSETFIELNLDLLPEDRAAYLWLLLSAEALVEGGSFADILERSEDYAAGLGERLRERVYLEVIPRLARAVVVALGADAPTREELDRTYEVALRILFRLLFVAYAEDRDLLPLHESRVYREHSLKRIAQRLTEVRGRDIEFGDEPFYWSEVASLWRAVSRGNPEWSVPRYNGSLFAADPATSVLGAVIERITLPDRAFAPALTALLVDETGEGREGPVDFRSLGVREFGTIYEGLLESELSRAETDLTVDPRSGAYLPAGEDDAVEVPAGEVYLHNRSGARKSTGSYYTKSFAVEHLLDRALEPALAEHLERLDAMSEREAGRRFFEFRVADIAMGSGHFLVAAVDRIERGLVGYLARRPLPDVKEELARLRRTALASLGDEWSGEPIEDAQLLRRQVARRCIFGVDLNPMAVELARLSIWIHTFVPGLPLGLLDQNLVQGNSLVGIATFDEASELMQADSGSLFSFVAAERLGAVREPLEKLGRLTDANDAEIAEARELYTRMRDVTRSEADLFTILTASRTNDALHGAIAQGQVATTPEAQADAMREGLVRTAEEELAGLDVLHFPLVFPHVFLGDRGGFDVILGNPPWEKPMVEEHAFWARHFPGLRAVSQREREALTAGYREERPDLAKTLETERAVADGLRELLIAGAYPGITEGHPDLYKAFVWRFWDLISPDGGRLGVVLPRSALAAKGGDEFRKMLMDRAETVDLTMLVNSGRWAFDMEPRYTIGLTAIARRDQGSDDSRLRLSGPYASLERFEAGVAKEPVAFYGSEVEAWNDTASLPLLPSDESAGVFAQLRKSPRLDLDDGVGWRARPLQGDLNSTTGKPLMDLVSVERPDGFWPVFKGESFDLWTPDTERDPMGESKRRRQRQEAIERKKGAYSEYLDRRLTMEQLQEERKKQLGRIAGHRDREVLVLAADFRKGAQAPISIAYEDILPFENLMEGLEGNAVDVILQTPGGSAEVAEDLVKLLRRRFEDVGFIVPGWAKSAGTIMAMAGDEILMGPSSALGPIDAQILWKDKVFSAEAFLEGLEAMKKEAEDQKSLNRAYIPILQQISPGEIQHAQNALDFARSLVSQWLEQYKFRHWQVHRSTGEPVTPEERKQAAEKIARALCRHQDWLSHGRSIKLEELRDLGLQVTDYSEDDELHDAVQRYHTLLQMTFESNIYKLFETEYGAVVRFLNVNPVPSPPSPGQVQEHVAKAGSVEANIECPLCKHPIPLQLKFAADVPDSPGRIPYPRGDAVTCPRCRRQVNLMGARREIEAQIGRSVVPQ